jgi:hypothetical protein
MTIAHHKKPIAHQKKPIAHQKKPIAHQKKIYSPPEETYSPLESTQENNFITGVGQKISTNTKMMTTLRTTNKDMTTISILPMTTFRLKENCPRKPTWW